MFEGPWSANLLDMTQEQLVSELQKLTKPVLVAMYQAQDDVKLPRAAANGPSKQDLAAVLAAYLDRKDFCRAYVHR